MSMLSKVDNFTFFYKKYKGFGTQLKNGTWVGVVGGLGKKVNNLCY